jgi:glycosyltransferase involved in cell wall biosynthesis
VRLLLLPLPEMKISIITPCLNRINFVGETVDSVVAQDYEPFEHLIIDAGSTDGTLDFLERYPHLQVFSEPDRGVYDGFNKGLRRASGDVILFLNSDDVLVPGVFAICAEIFRSTVGTMIVSGGCQIFRRLPDGREVIMHDYRNPRRYSLSLRNVTVGLPIINARFFRRSVFDRVGEFDLRYGISADRHFLIRAALQGIADAPVPKIFYRYRWHTDSLTMNQGNASLLQGMKESEQMIAELVETRKLGAADLSFLHAWRRECVGTEVMIHVVQKRFREALRTAILAWKSDHLFPISLLRVGSLAVARRIRTWCRSRAQKTAPKACL